MIDNSCYFVVVVGSVCVCVCFPSLGFGGVRLSNACVCMCVVLVSSLKMDLWVNII